MFFKIIYFLYFSCIAAYVPYLALYLERSGIPGTKIGLILAVSPALRVIVTPLWGMLADKKQWHRQIFIFCSLGAALIAPFYIFSNTFWAFMATQSLFIALRAPLVSISNKLAMEVQSDENFDFGRARLFGSIGFALTAIIGGRIAQIYDIWVLFGYLSFALFLVSILGSKLPKSGDTQASNLLENLNEIWDQKTLVIFFTATIIVRTAAIAPTSYVSILMDKLGAGEGLTGISWALPAIIEIPIFYYYSQYVKKVGQKRMILIGFSLTLLQGITYNFAYHPLVAVLGQLIRGMGFSIFYIAAVNFVDRLAPPRVRTTCQSLLTISNFGISALLGNLIGGMLYENFGIYYIYRFAVITAILGLSIFYFLVYKKKETGTV